LRQRERFVSSRRCEFELHKKEIELAEVANEEGGFVCCTRLIPPFFELRESEARFCKSVKNIRATSGRYKLLDK
jgi:hypothetical protein